MADEKQAPPYVSYRTLRNYLDALSVNPVPNRIDRTVLGNMSGQVQTLLLSALRYLGLVTEDGTPTEGLRRLVREEDDERKRVLALMLRERYQFLFAGFKLEGATPGQLRERFEREGVSGDTTRKSVAFFLAAAKDAGIALSPHLNVRTAKPRMGRQRRSMSTGNGASPDVVPQTPIAPDQAKTPQQVLWEMLDPHAMSDDEQQAVWTLMRYLKKQAAHS